MDLTISIHALVKRATRGVYYRQYRLLHFNPRPRKEGDVEQALLKRALGYISIHALVKRATLSFFFSSFATAYFNPRPRKEGDAL